MLTRGLRGISSPLGYSYGPEVVKATIEEPNIGCETSCSVLLDGSVDSIAPGVAIDPDYSGSVFFAYRGGMANAFKWFSDYLGYSFSDFAVHQEREDVAPVPVADNLKAAVEGFMEATRTALPNSLGFVELAEVAAAFSPAEICVPTFLGPSLPVTHDIAFVALLLSLCGPQVSVDRELEFSIANLLLPVACAPPADTATIARLMSPTTAGEFEATLGYRSGQLSTRSEWAWLLAGNLDYFVQHQRSSVENYDAGLSASGAAFLFSPPYPENVSPVLAGLVMLLFQNKLVRNLRLLGRIGSRPSRAFYATTPLGAGIFDDSTPTHLRGVINRWGDLNTLVGTNAP